MFVLKEGDPEKILKVYYLRDRPIKFACSSCDTEFIAYSNEYNTDWNSFKPYTAECPRCKVRNVVATDEDIIALGLYKKIEEQKFYGPFAT